MQSKRYLNPAAVCELWLRHRELQPINDAFWTHLNRSVQTEQSRTTYLA